MFSILQNMQVFCNISVILGTALSLTFLIYLDSSELKNILRSSHDTWNLSSNLRSLPEDFYSFFNETHVSKLNMFI